MVNEVLPDVPYVGLVFTIPKMLRKAFLFDRSLYGELSKIVYSSTRDFFTEHFPSLDDPLPGMIVVPQSFGELLHPHAHIHAVSSLGVFNRSDAKFHAAPADLDFSPLVEIVRERTLKMMFDREKITRERLELLRSWKHSGFNIDSSRRIEEGDRKSLESLLEYIMRPPVALSRLTYRENGMVHYQGRRVHPGLGKDHQLVSALELLAMLVPHIALKYEVFIRSYGAFSTSVRKQFGWIPEGNEDSQAPNVHTCEGEDSEFTTTRKRNWARLIAKTWLEDPEMCPKCGGHMVVLAAISSPEQDDVIENILRARGEWDPPWLHDRPARGPPIQLELFGENDAGASRQALGDDFAAREQAADDEDQTPSWDPADENQDPDGESWAE